MTKKFVFCDVDETIINLKSMFSFHDYWFQHYLPKHSHKPLQEQQREYADINAIMLTLRRQGASREELNSRYYEFFFGRALSDVKQCVQAWFTATSANGNFWIEETSAELRRLQAAGYQAVFVSGSFIELLQPIAEACGVEHILATRLATSGDIITGRIVPPQMIGSGKATAIAMFIAQHEAASEDCHAMGDDYSDIPMLEAVGHPIAVIGNAQLAQHAAARGWRTIALREEVTQ